MAQDPDKMSTDEIRSDIERTRVELGHTIDAIHDRLSPRRLMQDATQTVRNATIGRVQSLAQSVRHSIESGNGSSRTAAVVQIARNNPVAVTLVGAAASALMVSVLTRSRRPRLSKSLGSLAMTLAMAMFAHRRAQTRQWSAQEPFTGSMRWY